MTLDSGLHFGPPCTCTVQYHVDQHFTTILFSGHVPANSSQPCKTAG